MAETEKITLLVCAATAFELKTFWPEDRWKDAEPNFPFQENGITFVLTGVGIPQVLGPFQRTVQNLNPERILNIGIAGAYPNCSLTIGDIVIGQVEIYGDLGFELPDAPGFQPLSDVSFGAAYREAFPLHFDPNFEARAEPFHIANGCTVSTCTGTDATGRLRSQLFGAQFETMEGAAIAQIGQADGIPVCEIRAISNRAGDRDMRPENIALALKALRRYLNDCESS